MSECAACGGFYNERCQRWPACTPVRPEVVTAPKGALKRKPKCNHPYAKPDGNPDWPGLVCTECGKQVKDKDYG